MDEALRYDRDQIGLRDNVQSLQVVRNSQSHVALEPYLPEPGIHEIFSELTRDNGNMLRSEKLFRVSYAFSGRVATPYRARVTVSEETLLIKAFEPVRHTSNPDVNEPRELVWINGRATPRLNADTNARGLLPQSLQQRRKQQGAHMICHSQSKHTRAAGRFEPVPHQKHAYSLKRILYRIAKSFRASGKLHARSCTD
jgi:hypothetical protein